MALQTKFKAQSFDELIKPLQEYAKAYQLAEDQYNTLSAQSETLRRRANNDPNAQWAQRYNNYMNALNDSVSSLMTNGLNPTVRKQLLDARNGYASDVKPAEDAIKTLNEIAEYQSKIDPGKRMQFGANPTIDQLIANSALRPNAYNGSEIEKDAMQTAAAISGREIETAFDRDPDLRSWMKTHYEKGISNEDVNKIFNKYLSGEANTEESIIGQMIMKSIDETKNKYGYNNDNTLTDFQKRSLDNEVLSGFMKGLAHDVKDNWQANPFDLENLKAFNKKKEAQEDALNAIRAIKPEFVNYYGIEGYDNQTDYLNAKINDLSKYVNNNGELSIKSRADLHKYKDSLKEAQNYQKELDNVQKRKGLTNENKYDDVEYKQLSNKYEEQLKRKYPNRHLVENLYNTLTKETGLTENDIEKGDYSKVRNYYNKLQNDLINGTNSSNLNYTQLLNIPLDDSSRNALLNRFASIGDEGKVYKAGMYSKDKNGMFNIIQDVKDVKTVKDFKDDKDNKINSLRYSAQTKQLLFNHNGKNYHVPASAIPDTQRKLLSELSDNINKLENKLKTPGISEREKDNIKYNIQLQYVNVQQTIGDILTQVNKTSFNLSDGTQNINIPSR